MEARTEFRSCLSVLESVYYHHMLCFVLVINPVLWLFLFSFCMYGLLDKHKTAD
jgi:hypothetical protein